MGAAATATPDCCRSVITRLQLDPSAHAPWTRTTVRISGLLELGCTAQNAGTPPSVGQRLHLHCDDHARARRGRPQGVASRLVSAGRAIRDIVDSHRGSARLGSTAVLRRSAAQGKRGNASLPRCDRCAAPLGKVGRGQPSGESVAIPLKANKCALSVPVTNMAARSGSVGPAPKDGQSSLNGQTPHAGLRE
jgi:hypothetical protein